jgi:hypothetical protein
MFQIASGTTKSVKKFKIDFLNEAFFLDSHGEIRPLPSWFDTKSTKPKAPKQPVHCRLSFHFLHCGLYLILKFSFSDVPDSTWNTWNN